MSIYLLYSCNTVISRLSAINNYSKHSKKKNNNNHNDLHTTINILPIWLHGYNINLPNTAYGITLLLEYVVCTHVLCIIEASEQ